MAEINKNATTTKGPLFPPSTVLRDSCPAPFGSILYLISRENNNKNSNVNKMMMKKKKREKKIEANKVSTSKSGKVLRI